MTSAADAAYKKGKIGVTVMEDMLSDLLAAQLLAVHSEAGQG